MHIPFTAYYHVTLFKAAFIFDHRVITANYASFFISVLCDTFRFVVKNPRWQHYKFRLNSHCSNQIRNHAMMCFLGSCLWVNYSATQLPNVANSWGPVENTVINSPVTIAASLRRVLRCASRPGSMFKPEINISRTDCKQSSISRVSALW